MFYFGNVGTELFIYLCKIFNILSYRVNVLVPNLGACVTRGGNGVKPELTSPQINCN